MSPCCLPCLEYNAEMSDLKQPSRRISKPKAKPAVPAKAVGRAVRARTPKPVDRATMIEIFRRLYAANPEPKGELDYTNPYTLLVAVTLSAQATDVGVNKATRALFAVADTPHRMLDLGEEGLRSTSGRSTSSTPRRRTSSPWPGAS